VVFGSRDGSLSVLSMGRAPPFAQESLHGENPRGPRLRSRLISTFTTIRSAIAQRQKIALRNRSAAEGRRLSAESRSPDAGADEFHSGVGVAVTSDRTVRIRACGQALAVGHAIIG
jgi:hypothetical protein